MKKAIVSIWIVSNIIAYLYKGYYAVFETNLSILTILSLYVLLKRNLVIERTAHEKFFYIEYKRNGYKNFARLKAESKDKAIQDLMKVTDTTIVLLSVEQEQFRS